MFTQLAYQFNKNPQLDDDEGYEQIPTVKCPFDASHMMQPKNFLTHVYRCKSPNKHLYVQCRYDPCHWIYPENKAQHHQGCPTRLQHYMDMDVADGDWDDEEIQKKMQEKAMKEQHEKRKKKILKIIAYLKLKKQLEKQHRVSNQKKLPSTTRQNESDASTTYSEIKEKLKNLFLKKKHNKELDISRAQTEADFKKKESRVFQEVRTCINGDYPIIPTNFYNTYQQMQYHPAMAFYGYNSAYPSFQQNLQPYFQSSPITLQSYQQFQPFGYPSNMMLPQTHSLFGQNYPQQLPPHQFFPHILTYQPLSHLNHQQQAWEYQNNVMPARSKPEPEKSLKFQVNANTEDFIKKNILDDYQKSQTKTKISPEPDFRSIAITAKKTQSIQPTSNKIFTQYCSKLPQKVSKDTKFNKFNQKNDEHQEYKNQMIDTKQRQNKQKKRKKSSDNSDSEEQRQRKNKKDKREKRDKKQKKEKKEKEKGQKKKSRSKDDKEHKKVIIKDIVMIDRERDSQNQKQIREKDLKRHQTHDYYHRISSCSKNDYPQYEQKKYIFDSNPYLYHPHLYQNPQFQTQQLKLLQQKQHTRKHMANFPTSMPVISGLPESSFLKKKPQVIQVESVHKFEQILDNSISSYDFNPFNFSMDTTIKNESFRLMDERSQESMDMKEMLSILNEKIQKQKYKEKRDQFRLDARKLNHNDNSQKRRDYGRH